MVTRGNLRDGFTSELQSLAGDYDVTDASGNVIDTVTLSVDDIGLRHPEATETQPSIVYHENYRTRLYNGVGDGVYEIVVDSAGIVQKEIFREFIEAQFIIDVRASNETHKEPIYEALRRIFGKYQFGQWGEEAIHPDVVDVSVNDSTSRDTGDTESVIRGDQLDVRITFHRDYEFSTDTIETINTSIDVDGDDIEDINTTTT